MTERMEPGVVARTLLADDARWIADALLTTSTDRIARGWLPLVLLGHSSRIVYEGARLVGSSSPDVGVPEVAERLHRRFDPVIARARHGAKFLDDTAKSFETLHDEMAGFYASHRRQFTGNARWFARRWERDLSIVREPSGRILGSSIALHARSGLGSDIDLSSSKETFRDVAEEQGIALREFAALAGETEPPIATLDYRNLGRLKDEEHLANEYLGLRYDPVMTLPTKLLLLMIEGEVNATHLLLPETAAGHREAAFRGRLVSLFHTLRAVEQVLDAHPHAQTEATMRLRGFIDDSATRAVVGDPSMRRLRNRCMHYEIRDTTIELRSDAPMYGIVGSVCPHLTFNEISDQLNDVARQFAAHLHHWQ